MGANTHTATHYRTGAYRYSIPHMRMHAQSHERTCLPRDAQVTGAHDARTGTHNHDIPKQAMKTQGPKEDFPQTLYH
jgi:hypothetical protein